MNAAVLHAVGADPHYWMRERYRQAQYRGAEPQLANLDAIILRLVGPLEPARRPTQEAIDDAWSEAVGPFFAARSKPVALVHGKLVVECVHPAIIMELRPKLPALIQRLTGSKVKEIRLR